MALRFALGSPNATLNHKGRTVSSIVRQLHWQDKVEKRKGSKLLVATWVGDRSLALAQDLIHAGRLNPGPEVSPLFLSDPLVHHATALGFWPAKNLSALLRHITNPF